MKTKLLVVVSAALIGAATMSAHAGVFISFRLPLPPVPVVVVRPPVPVVVAPAVYAPVAYTPPAVVVTPPCPEPGYVWAPGYWAGHVWVGGGWHPGPHVAFYGHPYHAYGGHRW
jgi:hypothetical protein